jgi:hypothetical protein
MKVLQEGRRSYPQDPTRNFDFRRFEDVCGDFLLVEGYIDFRELKNYPDERIVYLEFDEPNRFFSSDPNFNHFEYEGTLYKVFTLCPYTAKWLNARYEDDKRVPIFFPFNEDHIPPVREKEFDVIYTGHILSRPIHKMLKDLRRYNYRIVSNSASPLVTDRGVSYSRKIDLISRSRVCLTHNLLFPRRKEVRNLQKIKDFKDNDAFRLVAGRTSMESIVGGVLGAGPVVPHIKSRVFEAAFCQSLILCRNDSFNVIENFFKPDREFIYFEPNELQDQLNDILRNFDSYSDIIRNAYNRATREYTTRAFVDRFLKNV